MATVSPTQVPMAGATQLTSSGTPFRSSAMMRGPANSTQDSFYNALPKYYGGSTVAGRTPDQINAQNMVRSTAQNQQGQLGQYLNNFMNTSTTPATTTAPTQTAANTINPANYGTAAAALPAQASTASALTGGVNTSHMTTQTAPTSAVPNAVSTAVGMDPRLNSALGFGLGEILTAGNPYSQAAMDSATRQITDNFTQQVLPQLGSAAQRSGAWGGSRQGIVESLAAGETAKAVGDTAAELAARNYETSLNTFNNALGTATNLRGQDVTQRGIESAEGLENRGMTIDQALQNRQISSQEKTQDRLISSDEALQNRQISSQESLRNREILSSEMLTNMQARLDLAVQNRQISSTEAQAQMNAAIEQELQNRQLTSQEQLANREISSNEGLQNRQLSIGELIQRAQVTPGLLDAAYKPAQMLDAIGTDSRAYDQQLIDADIQKHNFGQNADAERLALYASLLSGQGTSGINAGGGSTVTTKTPKSSTLQNAIGGASAGAALGSLTNFENGGTWGAVLGALAGLLD